MLVDLKNISVIAMKSNNNSHHAVMSQHDKNNYWPKKDQYITIFH